MEGRLGPALIKRPKAACDRVNARSATDELTAQTALRTEDDIGDPEFMGEGACVAEQRRGGLRPHLGLAVGLQCARHQCVLDLKDTHDPCL